MEFGNLDDYDDELENDAADQAQADNGVIVGKDDIISLEIHQGHKRAEEKERKKKIKHMEDELKAYLRKVMSLP